MYIVQKETLFQEECFLNNSQAMKEKNHFEIFFIISHLVQAPTPTTQNKFRRPHCSKQFFKHTSFP